MPEKEETQGLTVKKNEDFVEWYSQVVLKAELADLAPVKGFMVIRPNGYAVWEQIQSYFNDRIKAMGVRNAYFPLLIPETFFKREAEHAKGFAPELAWVEAEQGEERVAIRPTSETIMYDAYSKWIRSHRDLPLRINQWCNVLRWEVKQTKIFLRTREFLWQEGHCVYETKEDCDVEVIQILNEYQKLCEDVLAIPVLAGSKSGAETFAGALYTTAIESLMPDGKMLQMGTSHNLGQGFAKSFGISFLGRDGNEQTPWQSSWGVSTRLIGAVVMTHGDDKGLVLPPRVAEKQLVLIPIVFEKDKEKVLDEARKLFERLNDTFRVHLDDREQYTAGWKFNEWELKGVPLRLELGPKDIKEGKVVVVRRDTGEKVSLKTDKSLEENLQKELIDLHKRLYAKAKAFLDANIVSARSWEDFKDHVKDKKIAFVPFCGEPSCEERIKEETGATSRVFPFDQEKKKQKCFKCGGDAQLKAYFAKSY